MDTALTLVITIGFKLSAPAERDALETKITNFIAGQAVTSYPVNSYSNNPQNTEDPYSFQTILYVKVADVAAVNSARTAILSALDTMPVRSKFELKMTETGVNFD